MEVLAGASTPIRTLPLRIDTTVTTIPSPITICSSRFLKKMSMAPGSLRFTPKIAYLQRGILPAMRRKNRKIRRHPQEFYEKKLTTRRNLDQTGRRFHLIEAFCIELVDVVPADLCFVE